MLIRKIHCVVTRVNKMELHPQACPFLRSVSICKNKTVTKWQYFKELMAGLAWIG